LILLILTILSAYRADRQRSPHALIGELMYFPSGRALKTLSCGFYLPLADLVWFRFIQYYGEHRMTDAKFEYLYHILDILTTLDTRFTHAYTLGGLMLTYDADRPDQGLKLLSKGMTLNPDNWRPPFVYGFINYVFLRNYRVAQAYFRISSQKPNAPDFTKRWAAFILYKKLGDLSTAYALWLDLYNSTNNPEEKAIAKYYIDKVKKLMEEENEKKNIRP
jgi:hypothetical protein